MSTFLVRDEQGPRFRALETNIELHALAWTLYDMAGHACALDRTDGLVDELMLKRILPAWGGRRTRRAAAALVRIGVWREAGEGRYQFEHWDLEQVSADAEDKRRAKWAADKRRQRAAALDKSGERRIPGSKQAFDPLPKSEFRLFESELFERNEDEKRNSSAETTPDVQVDVHRGVHPDPDPSVSPAALTSPQTSPPSAATAPRGAPRKVAQKGVRKTRPNPHLECVQAAYAGGYERALDVAPPPPSYGLLQLVVRWAEDEAARGRVSFEEAVEGAAAGYFDERCWARARGYPLKNWADDPGRYFAEHRKRVPTTDELSDFDRQFLPTDHPLYRRASA